MATTYKIVNAKRGIYEETKTHPPDKQEVTIDHIRNMIVKCDGEIADKQAEKEYWEAKETAIKGIPGFEEPTINPNDPDPEPE